MLSTLPWWYFAVAIVLLLVFGFVCAALAYDRGFHDGCEGEKYIKQQYVNWLKESNEQRDLHKAELVVAVNKRLELEHVHDTHVIEANRMLAELRSELEDVTRRKEDTNSAMRSMIHALKVDMGKYGVQFDNPGFAPRTAVLELVNNVRSELRRELCTQNAIAERNALQDQLASLTDPAGPWAKKFIAAGVRKANKANKVKLEAVQTALTELADDCKVLRSRKLVSDTNLHSLESACEKLLSGKKLKKVIKLYQKLRKGE